MKEIFISYSSVDAVQASTIRTVLEKNGLSCWMAPRDIPGGSNYTKEIPIAIRNCRVFVLILSQNAQSSHWVLKELDSAVNNGKVILPFMLEDCALNDEFNFLLTGAQRYAAYQKKSEAMETLINRIRGILNVPDADSDSEPQAVSQEIVPEQPKPEPAKPAAAPVVSYIGEAKCPACHGDDLKALKNRVKCGSFKEYLMKLLIPAMVMIGVFLGLILAVFILPAQMLTGALLIILAGAILGIVCGRYLSAKAIKRSRLRHGFSSTCYRCKRCNKVFDYKELLDS